LNNYNLIINDIAMKNIFNFLILIGLFITAISCSDERSVERILDDPEQQDEILTAIANDSSMFTKLHQKVRENNGMLMHGGSAMMRSCMAMMDNPEMMNMMMDHMMMMGEKDSMMGMMMCDKMMSSENMKSMMEDRMHKDMEWENNKVKMRTNQWT
jgi:hypothetical protein